MTHRSLVTVYDVLALILRHTLRQLSSIFTTPRQHLLMTSPPIRHSRRQVYFLSYYVSEIRVESYADTPYHTTHQRPVYQSPFSRMMVCGFSVPVENEWPVSPRLISK